MRNNTSSAFLSLSTRMEKEIKEVFKDFPANMTTVVTELLPGSVIVRFGKSCEKCSTFFQVSCWWQSEDKVEQD